LDLTFRVRVIPGRSSFFAPTDINGVVLWLRSDVGITLNGSNVSAWADQSGQGNNAAQTTAANQPPFNAATGVRGLPKLSPTGTHWMTGLLPGVGNYTLFAVGSYPSPIVNDALFAAVQDPTFTLDSGFSQFTDSTSATVIGRANQAAGGTVRATTTDTTSLGTVGIYSTAAADATSVDLFINGVSKGSTTFANPLALSNNYALMSRTNGGSYNHNGDVYEFIVFNRVLTTNERIQVHRYLGGRYGIAVP
jgi:hypothetical protein